MLYLAAGAWGERSLDAELSAVGDVLTGTEATGISIAFECPVTLIVQELCESRGGRPGLPVLTSLLVSVDVKLYIEPCFGIGLSLSLICQLISEDIKHYLPTYQQSRA